MSDNRSQNRVLILRSNPVAPDPRVEKIARTLVKSGLQVDVFSWSRAKGLEQLELREGYRIFRKELIANYGSGLANLPNLLKWQREEFIWLWKHRFEYDIYHACDFDTVLPALILKFLSGKKLIYDIFDFYSDHLRKTPDWIKSLIRKIDLLVINIADGVIIVDEARKEQIMGSSPRELIVVNNSPDDISIHANNSPNQRTEEDGKLTIVYVGLLQVERGLFELLTIMGKHPEWSLELAGFGGDEEEIERRALSLPNVNYYGRIDYETAIELGSKADVLYALYDPENPNHKYASPNKVFEAMMLRKPVIVACGTNTDELVNRIGSGVVVDYHDLKSIEEGLILLAADSKLRARMGISARNAYEADFSWQVMEKRILDLYNALYAS